MSALSVRDRQSVDSSRSNFWISCGRGPWPTDWSVHHLQGSFDALNLGAYLGQHKVRSAYLVAHGESVWNAFELFLGNPKLIRGMLLIEPCISISDRVAHLKGRLHAVRCPIFVVGDVQQGLSQSLRRLPNSWHVCGGDLSQMIARALEDLPSVAFRYPGKRVIS